MKYICLCPIGLYGSTCHLNRTCVNKNPCGDHCEFDSAMVRINLTDFSFVQIPSNFILLSIIQLCDLHNDTLDLILREKRVYQGLPPSITLKMN